MFGITAFSPKTRELSGSGIRISSQEHGYEGLPQQFADENLAASGRSRCSTGIPGHASRGASNGTRSSAGSCALGAEPDLGDQGSRFSRDSLRRESVEYERKSARAYLQENAVAASPPPRSQI